MIFTLRSVLNDSIFVHLKMVASMMLYRLQFGDICNTCSMIRLHIILLKCIHSDLSSFYADSCSEALAKVEETLRNSPVVGLEKPRCRADGTYLGMQYRGSM